MAFDTYHIYLPAPPHQADILSAINRLETLIMATKQETNAKLDDISASLQATQASLNNISADTTGLVVSSRQHEQEIASLREQLAADGVDPEILTKIDAIHEQATSLRTQAESVDQQVDASATNPTETPPAEDGTVGDAGEGGETGAPPMTDVDRI